MVGIVLLVVDAGGDQLERRARLVGGEKAVLGRRVAAGFDEEVLAVAGAAYSEVKAFVRLMVHQHGWFLSAEGVAEELVVALGLLVLGRVEEGNGVDGPDEGADAFGGVGQVLSGREIAHMQRVLAEAGVVGRVGEQAAVGADGHGADGHVGLALRELIDVEQDLLGQAGLEAGFGADRSDGPAAVDGVLATFDGSA